MGTPKDIATLVIEEGKKLAARALIAGAAAGLLMLWAPFRDRVVDIWNSPDTLFQIQQEIQEMRGSLMRATGEDRVVRQMPGQSYVAEPVHHGDRIIVNLVMQRTRLGSACRLLRRTPIFADLNGVRYAGEAVTPSSQLGAVPERLRIEVQHPSDLPAGRVELYFVMEFDCGGDRVFDQTEIMVFRLMPAR
jgi:hypothetical protein